MVRAIISWSLHHRLIVLLGTLALILVGVHSALNLNVEAYPDPTPPLVEVITQNPGASPEEMERLIGIPLETTLNGMPGLKQLRSTSVAGLNDIKCQFDYGTDYWKARQEVINRLQFTTNLPQGVTPGLSPWSPTGEIVRYVLEGPGYTTNDLKAVQDWVLNRALKQVPGVIDVTGYGGTVKQYQVLVDPRLLTQYNLTLQTVASQIGPANANVGGNVLSLGSQAHNVRALGLFGKGLDPLDPANAERIKSSASAAASTKAATDQDEPDKAAAFAALVRSIENDKLADIRRVCLASNQGVPIYVSQVSRVVVGSQPRLGIVGRTLKGDVAVALQAIETLRKAITPRRLTIKKEPLPEDRTLDTVRDLVQREDYAAAYAELAKLRLPAKADHADEHAAQAEALHQIALLGYPDRFDEDDVIEGIVLMRKYEKSLPTSQAVETRLKEVENEGLLPPGMHIRIFNRRTDLVHVTTHNVLHNLLVGMGLVIAVLFVFLGDLSSAAIVAIMIPLALLFSITVLYLRGESANLLSIGAVDFGIIVDSSVIIVENIYRHITARNADRTRPLIDRIAEASHEIERALFFSTMIIITAFIPLFSMTGPEGALFGPMANTYAFAICGALIMALTLAPVLCSFLFHNKKEESDTFVDRLMKVRYLKALKNILAHRFATLAVMIGLLAFTITLVPTLGGEFMPQLEEGNLWVRALIPRTTSLEEASRIAPKLRRVMNTIPEVRGVMSHVGRPDDGTDVSGYFNLEFNVPLKPMEEWRPAEGIWGRLGWKITREQIEADLAEKFQDFPGINFNFSQLIRDNVEEALSGVKGANSIKIFGSDLTRLEEIGQKVTRILKNVRGTENVGLFHIVGQPNLEIDIDRDKCARYGLNVDDVENIVQVAIGGKGFTQMVEGEKLYDIVLRLPGALRDDPDGIARIPVDIPVDVGQPTARVPLGQIAKIQPHKGGASYIYRENNRRFVPIKFSIRGRDLASTIADAKRRIEDPKSGVVLPRGYRIEWSGEFAQMQAANERLMWIVPASIGLIMLLLYTAFSSAKDALLVMANVVAATMGGVWALKLTSMPFSISAAVGFISIFGVAVQDGVLLISYFNQMRSAGLSVRESVMRGAELRVRPVVMTSLTAAPGPACRRRWRPRSARRHRSRWRSWSSAACS